MKIGGKLSKILITLAVTGFFVVGPSQVTVAATSSQCSTLLNRPDSGLNSSQLQQKKSCLQQQYSQTQQQLSQTKQQAQNLQGAISNLDGNIASTSNQIANTESQIQTTTALIQDLNSEIQDTQSQLDDLNGKLNIAYDNLYELSQTSTAELLLQSKSLNDLLSQTQYIQAIQTDLQANIDKANQLRADLQSKKSTSEAQKSSLEQLNSQLNDSKNSLASQRVQKNILLQNTNSQANSLSGTIVNIQNQINKVQQQINILSSRSTWGTDIVSDSPTGWYYNQNNYPGVLLGNTPYSLKLFGCLVTSYAMVASFYGHHTTPVDIANTDSNFNSDGALVRQPPAPTNLSSVSTQPVNWSVVNQELDSGRPVIVSIYISSVGALNSDGSSHFIVLDGHSGSKYFMQDPLGTNRGYAAGNVRSMKLVRP